MPEYYSAPEKCWADVTLPKGEERGKWEKIKQQNLTRENRAFSNVFLDTFFHDCRS